MHKVIILFTIINRPFGSENCLVISNSKLLLNNIHTPLLALEKLLKMAEHRPILKTSSVPSLWWSGLLAENRLQISSFRLSHRKVSCLFTPFDSPRRRYNSHVFTIFNTVCCLCCCSELGKEIGLRVDL